MIRRLTTAAVRDKFNLTARNIVADAIKPKVLIVGAG